MKRTIIAIAAAAMMACAATDAAAQQKGDKFVGTLIGFSMANSSTTGEDGVKEKGDPVCAIELDPGFHYFVADHFRIGAQMQLTHQWQKNDESDTKTSSNNLAIGPTAAYYIRLADRFHLAPELGFFYCHGKMSYERDNHTADYKTNGFELAALPVQLEFRPTDRIGLGVSLLNLEFAHMKRTDADISGNAVNFNIMLNPTVGVRVFL